MLIKPITAALAGIFASQLFAAETKPNIVLIFADDLGYGDLSCYGAAKIQTPNIDKLAAEGRRFTDSHSASAVCTPSRYALLTGQYPIRANEGRGVWGPLGTQSKLLIDTDQLTIAKVLKKNGYATSCFGKWHLGFGNGDVDWNGSLRPGPQDVGFDYYFGIPVVNSYPPYVYVENDRVYGLTDDDPLVSHRGEPKPIANATPITPLTREMGARTPNFFSGGKEAHKRYNDFTVATTLTEHACAWIEERDDKPFFLYLPTTNVHHPCTPAPRFQGTSECGLYGDFIHELDWMVGEVMKTLEKKGIAENTLVIFTSDNGGMFNENGQDAFKHGHRINGDLLGFKFGAWEGGHRVPFIAKWPGKIEPGTSSDQLICHVDMLASFAALTSLELGEEEQGDSINILPAMTENPAAPLREELILAPASNSHLSNRQGKWMFIDAQGSGGFTGTKPGGHGFAGPAAASFSGHPNSDIVDGELKEDAPLAQLYDLEADVNQTTNLYNEHPELVKEMRTLLKNFRAEALEKGAVKRQANEAPRTVANSVNRSASFDFESGNLAPWQLIEGSFGHPIGNREKFLNQDKEFNKQGNYYLTTLESGAEGGSGKDSQTGVIISPLIIPEKGTMTFRIGGGAGSATYVALCTEDGAEVLKARGINSQAMQLVSWDLEPYSGEKMFIKITDRSTGGWGHVTADDFQFDGEILGEYANLSSEPEVISLFDGETLNDWETINPEKMHLWSVKDGMIECSNNGKSMPGATYLATKEEFGDFEFNCEFRLSGDPATGLINSGIQYRSKVIKHPKTGEPLIQGYQADIGKGYWGSIYDECRRASLVEGITDALFAAGFQDDKWHRYRIVCKGSRHRIYINGFATADFRELDPAIPDKGVIAFQVHAGGVAKLQLRNITIQKLPKE